jgi:hypothetical protein
MGGVTDPLTSRAGSRPNTSEGSRAFVVRPFQRLARTHVANNMADAMLAAALADSIFFSLPADNARGPVLRYLVITMAPFAVIAPLIGPLIDRLKGGHRFVLVGTMAARAVLAWLLIGQISDDTPGPLFFLLALLVLVGQRAYNVARSALVPTVVNSDGELVEANSKLAIIGGFAGFVGIVPAAILLKLFGPGWALSLAVITYTVGGGLGLRIPGSRVATAKADLVERQELRGAGIQLAQAAMALLRGFVGFMTMLIAFDFRGGDKAAWQFGIVAAVSVIAGLVGAAVAPKLRDLTSEETILTSSLGLVVSGAFASLFIGEVSGACIVGACVGFAAALGKLAFDSILQRDAPDANRGRAFARAETKFQLFYVAGSLIPVAFHVGAKFGFGLLLGASLFAIASYVIGRMAWAHRSGERQTAATAAAVGIEERFGVVTGEVKDRLAAAPRSVMHRIRGGEDAPLDPDQTVLIDPGDPGPDSPDERVAPPADPPSDDDGPPTVFVAAPVPPSATTAADEADVDEIDAQPSWGDDPTPVPTGDGPVLFDQDLAPTSPVAWTPPDEVPTVDASRAPTQRAEGHDEPPWPGGHPQG